MKLEKKNAEKEQAVQPNTCAYRDGRKLGRKQTVFCEPFKHCASAQKQYNTKNSNFLQSTFISDIRKSDASLSFVLLDENKKNLLYQYTCGSHDSVLIFELDIDAFLRNSNKSAKIKTAPKLHTVSKKSKIKKKDKKSVAQT